jgi:hypothetical protein
MVAALIVEIVLGGICDYVFTIPSLEFISSQGDMNER